PSSILFDLRLAQTPRVAMKASTSKKRYKETADWRRGCARSDGWDGENNEVGGLSTRGAVCRRPDFRGCHADCRRGERSARSRHGRGQRRSDPEGRFPSDDPKAG